MALDGSASFSVTSFESRKLCALEVTNARVMSKGLEHGTQLGERQAGLAS